MAIFLHHADLPDGFTPAAAIAVDCEMMGLNVRRDRLCLVQISNGDGDAHLVQIGRDQITAPNLTALMGNAAITKIFHYGRADLGVLMHRFGVLPAPIFDTKIASKLARTYTDAHGLSALVAEVLGLDLSKKQQSSDWGADTLTQDQLEYAARDVLHLHALRDALIAMLIRENRMALAEAAFAYLPERVRLDLAGWGDIDIFAH